VNRQGSHDNYVYSREKRKKGSNGPDSVAGRTCNEREIIVWRVPEPRERLTEKKKTVVRNKATGGGANDCGEGKN